MTKHLKRLVAATAALAMALGLAVSAQAATYVLDFSQIPVTNIGGDRVQDEFSLNREGFSLTVAPGAAQPTLSWSGAGGNFRANVMNVDGAGVAGTGWIDPNGGGRTLSTTVALSGPITVAITGFNWNYAGGTPFRVNYGADYVMLTMPQVADADRTTLPTVYHTFAAGSGVVTIDLPWGGSGDAAPGRLAIRTVAIYEGGRPAGEVEQAPVGGEQDDIGYGDKADEVEPPETGDTTTIILAVGASVLLVVLVAAFVVVRKRARG